MRADPGPLPALNPTAFGLPVDFAEQMRFAEFVATSDLVPKALQNKPANCFLVMQKAYALSLPWDVAMSGIHVIDSKVTPGAKLLRMLLRKAGHDFDPHTVTDKEAKATLTLLHRPTKPVDVSYTLAEAQAAGLTGKQVWKNHVKSMLVAAVTRRAVDWYCPEVAMGLDLSDDTLAATFGEPGEPIRATAEVVPGPRRSPEQDAGAAGVTDVVDADTVDDSEAMDPQTEQALDVLDQARAATDVGTLTKLGKEARTKGILDVVVAGVGSDEPVTLKDALMVRMREVESGQGPAV